MTVGKAFLYTFMIILAIYLVPILLTVIGAFLIMPFLE